VHRSLGFSYLSPPPPEALKLQMKTREKRKRQMNSIFTKQNYEKETKN
jgi:hypothetical protein